MSQPGLILILMALVARRRFAFDQLEQLLNGVLNADRDPAGNFSVTAPDVFPKRHSGQACFEVPHGGLQPATRHLMALGCGR